MPLDPSAPGFGRTDVGRALRDLAGAGPPDGSHLGRNSLGSDVIDALRPQPVGLRRSIILSGGHDADAHDEGTGEGAEDEVPESPPSPIRVSRQEKVPTNARARLLADSSDSDDARPVRVARANKAAASDPAGTGQHDASTRASVEAVQDRKGSTPEQEPAQSSPAAAQRPRDGAEDPHPDEEGDEEGQEPDVRTVKADSASGDRDESPMLEVAATAKEQGERRSGNPDGNEDPHPEEDGEGGKDEPRQSPEQMSRDVPPEPPAKHEEPQWPQANVPRDREDSPMSEKVLRDHDDSPTVHEVGKASRERLGSLHGPIPRAAGKAPSDESQRAKRQADTPKAANDTMQRQSNLNAQPRASSSGKARRDSRHDEQGQSGGHLPKAKAAKAKGQSVTGAAQENRPPSLQAVTDKDVRSYNRRSEVESDNRRLDGAKKPKAMQTSVPKTAQGQDEGRTSVSPRRSRSASRTPDQHRDAGDEHAGHPGRSQARRPGMPQSAKGMKGPPPKHLSNGSQMLLESETLPGQLSPGADDSTTFHETPQHLAPSLVSSPLSEHLQSHASTAPGHFPFEHEYEGHRAAMLEQQYPKAGHMSPRRIHSAHEARRLEEAGAAHSEHDASVYWHPHYGWVEREPDDFKMVHPARFPERLLPTGCGARYPAHHAPDVPHYFAEQSSQPHRPLGQHSQLAAPGSDGHQRQFVSGQELDESSRAQRWEARAAPQQHMAPPPHMSGASRLQQQMLLLQQEQEMLLSLSNSRHMPSHAQEYIAPSDAKAVPSRLQSQHSTEDAARKGVQKSPRQERSTPPTQTSYPLAQHFLQQHGLNDQQEDPFARQTVQSTFKSGKTQAQAKQLSPSHSPVHSALQSQQDELLYSASTGQGMQGSPSLRTLAASTSAPAYPRARELEHQRRLLQERHDELRAHPQGNLSCTPRTQHRKGGGLVQNGAKTMSRSSSAKAITAKGNNSRFPDSGPPRSPSVPRSPGTNRPAHTAVIKDLGKTAVFVEPIAVGRRPPRSQTVQTVQTVHPKPGHKEAHPRAVERSGSPFAGHRASPVRSDRSAPAAAPAVAVRPARAAQPARPARPDGTKPVSPSRGSSHSSPRSPRSPRSERSPQGLASNPKVNRQVQPKAKPTKIKASDESLRGPGAAAPAERLLCSLAQRTQQLQQRPLGDPSPERLPRKPAVPLAPRSPRSQTPPKKSPAGPAGLAGLASYLPGGPAEPSKASADFADKVAALPLQPDKTKMSEESQGGRVYMGFRDGKGQKSGYGVMQADGTTYTGQWCGSKREGYGTLFFKGGVFEGQWLQGNAHGRGAIHFQNGDTFEGTYAHNKKCGHGVYTWADGTNEAGEYLGGQKDGIHVWRSGGESWEVVYEKGTVVATRRVDTADTADTVDRSDTVTTAKEDVTDLRPHRSSDMPSVSAAPTAAEARTASTARAGSEKETPRALDKARPAPRPTPPPSPPCPSAKAGQLGSLPSNRCRSDSAFRAQGFTDQEIALIERRSPPSSPAAAPDRAAQPGGCSVRVYFPTSARSRTRDTSRGPCGAAPRVSAPEAATADAAAGAAAPAWPQAAAAPSEDSSAQRVQEMDNDSDQAPTRLRETTPERPERPDVSPFEVATFSEKGSCD